MQEQYNLKGINALTERTIIKYGELNFDVVPASRIVSNTQDSGSARVPDENNRTLYLAHPDGAITISTYAGSGGWSDGDMYYAAEIAKVIARQMCRETGCTIRNPLVPVWITTSELPGFELLAQSEPALRWRGNIVRTIHGRLVVVFDGPAR